jgi:uncharacterized protein (DUF58 family)
VAESSTQPSSLLDPETVSRGELLGLMARKIVEGYRVGEHRSPFHGFAIEFAQHREYAIGDDMRHLDWKVLGRSDRYYIKQYEQDTNYVAQLIIDGSKSMNYGSGKITKLHMAKGLAACIAYLILSQRDAVSVAVFDTETRVHVPRTDNLGKIQVIMKQLADFQATDQTKIGRALEQVAGTTKSRGIVILISDLLDDEPGFLKGLEMLTFSGSEVIVFHTLDNDELTFPLKGTVRFHGLEGQPMLQTSPADIRKTYLKNFDEYRQRIRHACEKFNAHYVLADTSKSLAEILSGYLAFRRATGRK